MVQKVFAAVAVVMLLALVFLSKSLFENVDAGEIVVIQSPVKGTLNWYKTPGVKPQWFGGVTSYYKRDQFWFSAAPDQGMPEDQSLRVRFNDGGHATISGSISWEMPLKDEQLNMLRAQYGTHDAIQQQLIRTVVEKAVYMTGPLMSSKESYAEKRNDLLMLIEDQIEHGVYRTETSSEQHQDPMTGAMRTVNVVKLVRDDEGKLVRAAASPLEGFGIKTFNLSINEIRYDPEVEKQIQQQQQAVMQVQIAVAEAKKAEQAAITAEKNGQAAAMTTKWAQEAIKAQKVTEAEQEKEVATISANQRLEVARLNALAAEQYKVEQTKRGEGDAAYKQKVMEADGALNQKLEALVKINQAYAAAIQGYQGNWVPQVVYGGGSVAGQAAGSGAQQLIDLLTAKTARDVSIDMAVSGADKTKQNEK